VTASLKLTFAATLAALACTAGHAQSIERMKMTDNDLSCQQIYGEIAQMDGVIARATQPAAPAAAAPADPNAQPGVGAAVVGAVAQQALNNAGSRSGFGGFGGGFGGGLGGLFGQIAQAATQQQAQPVAAPQKIFPGFMMFFGSSARLMVRIMSTAPAPASVTRKPILCRPTPCSPVQVPPSRQGARHQLVVQLRPWCALFGLSGSSR
jgi:hypothetical protein